MKKMKKILLLSATLLLSGIVTAQWVSQATTFTAVNRGVTDIHILDANTVWGLGYDGSGAAANVQEFTKTNDGGSTWTSGVIDVFDTTLKITNIFPTSATNAWIGTFDNTNGLGGVWKTVDGGLTWNQQNSNAYSTAGESWLDVVHFFNSNVGLTFGDPFAATLKFEIYKTTDGGANWTPINTVSALSGEYGYNGGVAYAGNSVWFTTNKGKLIRTTDMGLTWSKLNTPITDFGGTAAGGTVYFADNNNGVLLARATTGTGTTAVSTYKIHTTTNGGLTWSSGVAYTKPYRSLSFIPGSTTLVGVGSETVGTTTTQSSAYSTDYGVTWTLIDSGVQRTDIAFLDGSTGWAGGFATTATTDGIYKYTGPALGMPNFNATKNQISAFPNPTNGAMKISGATPINEFKVFDLLGKEVLTAKFSAVNEVNIDLSPLQMGTYLLKTINVAGITESIKIVKN